MRCFLAIVGLLFFLPACGSRAVRHVDGAGKSVAFAVEEGTGSSIVVQDRWRGKRLRFPIDGMSEGNPSVAAHGETVVFASASPLVSDDANGFSDVYVLTVARKRLERLSTSVNGGDADGPSTAPLVSLDGRFVAFASSATNLLPGDDDAAADIFVIDLQTGARQRVRVADVQPPSDASLKAFSGDGRTVVFAVGATLYVHDLLYGTTEIVQPTM